MDAVLIAFASGKGGTGKSTTAVYTASALAARGKRVLLCELDFGLRCVDIIAGISGEAVFDLGDVLAGRCSAEKATVQSPYYDTFFLLSAPFGKAELDSTAFFKLCLQLKSAYDYILLDTAAGLGTSLMAATEVAHRIVLVLTPDPVALRDGRLVADQLDGGRAQLRLLLNRVGPPARQADTLPDLDTAIDTVGAQLLGVVPDSAAILKAAATGRPLPLGSVERDVFDAVAGRLLGEHIPLKYR